MLWEYFQPKFEYEKTFNDIDWPWAGHKYFAYDIIRNLKPNLMVELGTHYGTSFFSMAQAAKDAKLDIKLVAIDTWEGDSQAGFYEEDVIDTVKKIQTSYYPKQNLELKQMYFDQGLADFKDNSIDLLHIDGLHTYEAVKVDFESWLPKVKKDGIILFHDTHEHNGDFGVYKLWDQLKKKFDTMEFKHSHGLGILFKGGFPDATYKPYERFFQYYYPGVHAQFLLPFRDQELQDTLDYIHEVEGRLNDNAILMDESRRRRNNIKRYEDHFRNVSSTSFFKVWQLYSGLKNNE